MSQSSVLQSVIADNRAGKRRGIASWCTAHPDTLRAILGAHADVDGPILIEATCNQVNHRGGYTGMTPAAFRHFVERLAAETGIERRRILLGGDHLGPNPWRHLPAAQAMAEAKLMVRAYAEAGFRKIHLDASMACAGDDRLTEEAMAERAAELCSVAEDQAPLALDYVIGTEVPVPGGETGLLDTLAVTKPEAASRTYALHKAAFARQKLEGAFSRVVGIVVQPGVDFGNAQVFGFEPRKAAALSTSIGAIPSTVFEAHSTDYQTAASLTDLVASHFAILKVGPELTFAYREAVFAMAAIEEFLSVPAKSEIVNVIDSVMDDDDRYWKSYVAEGSEQRILKLFGLSDRVRYYWPDPRITSAVEKLRANIDGSIVPQGLLAQYAGANIVENAGKPLSTRIIDSKVSAVVQKYLSACGSGPGLTVN
jgi:D-tagatose-bisphosphate aldolase class II non-catalytic subunit